MEVRILVKEKNTLELELVGGDQSLAQLLADKVGSDKDVEFSSFKVEHPLTPNPKILVRTKKGDPTKIILEKLAEIKTEVADFKKQFLDIAK